MKYEYYYNQMPGQEPWRNNLIYTSLMSEDGTVFVQWYYNDTAYHQGQNQVVDPELMEEKWQRELKYLQLMRASHSHLVPEILDIDYKYRKIYLRVNGNDFWQRKLDVGSFDAVLPNWREQMLEIIDAHKKLKLHKYSMHPSSYFLVDGQLKSINYFFTYHDSEPYISIADVESHIYSTRQEQMKKVLAESTISWNDPQPWTTFDWLCWNSFRSEYPADFVEEALKHV